jgi:hypothetical protein
LRPLPLPLGYRGDPNMLAPITEKDSLFMACFKVITRW